MTAAHEPIPRRKLVLFALPEYAVYLGGIPVALYLPFVYAKDFGLELADVGLILMLARVSDVITDPLIGYLSDRTGGRFGRRKPWMAGGNFAAISMSMKADVIEIASRRSGEDIAASYIAVWSLGQKLVGALALGLALPLLQALGFSADGGNSPEDTRMLSYVHVLPPWLCYALAVVVIWRYPISAARLARIRERFDRRDARRRNKWPFGKLPPFVP